MEALNLRSFPKDGDGGDEETFIENIIVSVKDNGFLVTCVYEDDTETQHVYTIKRDEKELVKDLINSLGLSISIKE